MIKREHYLLLGINVALILGFGAVFVVRANYEFLIYVGVVVVLLGLVAVSMRSVAYTWGALIGLTVWSAMHLAGGAIQIGDGRLYDLILLPLSRTYPILRYDQLVHLWGFGAATVVGYCLLAEELIRPIKHPIAVGIVITMTGLGLGALNEILEFGVMLAVPGAGVGGYLNTSLDLVADLIGALGGLCVVWRCYLRADA